MNRLNHSLPIALGFFTVLLLSACHQDDKALPPKPPSDVAADEIRLPTDSSKRGYIKEMRVLGEPVPLMEPVAGKLAYDETRTTRITSPIAGRVVSRLPELGASVTSGMPLVELDSPDLGQAKEDYANAQADQQLAEQSYERAKKLYEGSVIPRKDLQKAEDDLTRARNETQRTRMHLHNLGVDEKGIDNRFALRSPIQGVITERHVNPGMEVRPDLPDPLFVISDLSQLWLLMNVFEKDLSLIHTGKQVQVSVPAYPDRKFPATIEYIDKVVDDTTRTIRVRCNLPNPDGKLLPDMFASVEVQSDAADRGILVPLSALFTEGEGDSIFVVTGDGVYKRRPVKLGLRLKDRAVVAEGLRPGETIVAEGALLLRTEEANEADQDGAEPPKP